MHKTIALVEDDDIIRENYVDQLQANGFVVRQYASRAEAELAFHQALPDLALLDIGLNEEREGGFELCRFIRKTSESVPVIFLTSYNDDINEISGLRVGADDYISKDESFEKILVRINSLLRRVAALTASAPPAREPDSPVLQEGDLAIDLMNFDIKWKGAQVRLPLTQLWILCALVKRPGHIKSKEALMEAANITHSGSNTIPVHINSIRNKFKQVDPSFNQISNERGIGYKWTTLVVS